MKNPVIILASANSKVEPLPALREEADQIQKALHQVEPETGVQTVFFPWLSVERIVETINQRNWCIQIFHFAGHADGGNLKLTDQSLAFGNLGRQMAGRLGTKVAFLNGCGTMPIVKDLLEAGVPAVMATRSAISDAKASIFARHFYNCLAQGQNLEEAFQTASDLLASRFSDDKLDFQVRSIPRTLNFGPDRLDEKDRWELVVREGSESILKWTLYDHRKKKIRRRRMWKCLIGSCIAMLLLILAINNIKVPFEIGISIKDTAGDPLKMENPPPKGYELVFEHMGEQVRYPLQSWKWRKTKKLYRFPPQEFRVFVAKGDTAYSDPNSLFIPSDTTEKEITVFTFHLNLNPVNVPNLKKPLELEVSYCGRQITHSYTIDYPYEIRELLPYSFFTSGSIYADIFLSDPEYELRNCTCQPPKKGFVQPAKGYSCAVYKKNPSKNK